MHEGATGPRALRGSLRQDGGRQVVRRSRAHSGLARPRHHLRRSPDRHRHAVLRKLSRVGTLSRHAGGGPAVLRDRRSIARDLARRSARWRANASAGCRASLPKPPKPRVTMFGDRWDPALRRPAPVPLPQPDHLRLGDARRAGVADAAGRGRSRAKAIARCCGSPTARCSLGPQPRDAGAAPRPADQPRASPNTTPSSSAAARPASPPRCTARPRGCARWSSSARRRAARPGRRRGSRTISASRAASPATSWRVARSSRRGGSAPRSWSRARSPASIPRRTRSSSMATRSSGRGPSSSPPASAGAASTIDGFDRLIGKGIYYGAARSEAGARQRTRRPPHRRRQLGRPGGDATSPTTRAR